MPVGVIVQSAIEAHIVKGEIDLHKQVLFVWDKNYSVDRPGELICEALEFFLGSPHGKFCS